MHPYTTTPLQPLSTAAARACRRALRDEASRRHRRRARVPGPPRRTRSRTRELSSLDRGDRTGEARAAAVVAEERLGDLQLGSEAIAKIGSLEPTHTLLHRAMPAAGVSVQRGACATWSACRACARGANRSSAACGCRSRTAVLRAPRRAAAPRGSSSRPPAASCACRCCRSWRAHAWCSGRRTSPRSSAPCACRSRLVLNEPVDGRKEPVSSERNEPVAAVSTPGATSIVTVG